MLATNACVQILIKGMDLTPQPEVEGSIADRVKLLVDTTCFTLFRCGFCLQPVATVLGPFFNLRLTDNMTLGMLSGLNRQPTLPLLHAAMWPRGSLSGTSCW